MTADRNPHRHPLAFTLVELTLVIAIMLMLVGIGFSVSGNSRRALLGREAGEALRSVYTAQRLYLSDYPLEPVATLTAAKLVPYLPNRMTTIPTVKSLTNTTLNIKVTVFPPVVVDNGGITYDPSGNSKDSLWDVGE
jgi:type II secretory pathway pseudopilin PulG